MCSWTTAAHCLQQLFPTGMCSSLFQHLSPTGLCHAAPWKESRNFMPFIKSLCNVFYNIYREASNSANFISRKSVVVTTCVSFVCLPIIIRVYTVHEHLQQCLVYSSHSVINRLPRVYIRIVRAMCFTSLLSLTDFCFERVGSSSELCNNHDSSSSLMWMEIMIPFRFHIRCRIPWSLKKAIKMFLPFSNSFIHSFIHYLSLTSPL